MRLRFGGRRAPWRALAAMLALVAVDGARAEIADEVFEAVQAGRLAAGVAPLERRGDLDDVARDHAERVAALPQGERLAAREQLGDELRSRGIEFRRVGWHVDFNRGYRDPAAAFARSWSRYAPGWTAAISAEYDAAGLAAVRAADGWIVLVAVLLGEREARAIPQPAELESAAIEATNRARSEHGRAPLRVSEALTVMAREHSRDMQSRGFFDHHAPDGTDLRDRARRHGLDVARIAENLHANRGVDDPVATAVAAWLASPEHRKQLLSTEYRETGIGVAVGDDGSISFTQLFLAGPTASGDGAR